MAVCIRKRGKSYSAYWREDGKIKEVSLGRRLEYAKMRQRELEHRIKAKRNGLPVPIRWDEFQEKYFSYSKTNHTPQTTIRTQTIFKNFIDVLPVNHLNDITTEYMEEFKLARHKAGIKASTINRELSTLRFAIKQAQAWGYEARDLKSVRRIPEVKKRPNFFSTEQIQSLMDAASPLWKTVILLGFYAGLRRDEILHLGWPDIDFERGQIRITPKDDWHPKDREAREVPIHPTLEKYLLELKNQPSNSGRVVPWPNTPIALTEAFSRMRARRRIPFGSLHTLRHSFASHLAMNGVDLNKIRVMMGHYVASPLMCSVVAFVVAAVSAVVFVVKEMSFISVSRALKKFMPVVAIS